MVATENFRIFVVAIKTTRYEDIFSKNKERGRICHTLHENKKKKSQCGHFREQPYSG